MKPEFSLVIPVLNEEESLRELISQIKKTFKSAKKYEIIFVDDGSTDHTVGVIKECIKHEKNIRLYSFRRNLGKSRALTLGFQKARGTYVATLDADLQDDPKNISILLRKMEKGNYDMITGWRRMRRDPFYKILSSRLFNNIVSWLFGIKIHDLNSGLKLYKQELAKELELYGGMHRFIPVIAYEMGYKVGEKVIVHHQRKYGKSKYKFTKIFTDIPDLITIYFLTKYTRRPLHFFGKVGSFLLGIGVIILAYLSILHFMGHSIGDRPLLIFGVLLVIAGIQTIFTGLIADLIVNLNDKETRNEFPIKYASHE